MQMRHDPTFFAATQRLPREVRPAVHALYGYVRAADELVDAPRPGTDPKAALDAWERALDDGRRTGTSPEPVVAALVDAADRHDLPLDELKVYMASMRVDCGPVRIRSREELDTYMNGSAAGRRADHGAAAGLRRARGHGRARRRVPADELHPRRA
jgi:phytoene synthase